MSSRSTLRKIVLAGIVSLGSCTPPSQPVQPVGAMPMTTTIVITNSGSTNTIGYRILIAANGQASWASGDGTGAQSLPSELFNKLSADLKSASPLSAIPTSTDCMKPASFGTSTFVAVGADRSPDLTCASNPLSQSLMSDISAVAEVLKLRNVPRGEGKDLPPQNF